MMRIALSRFPSAKRVLAYAVVCFSMTSSLVMASNPTWYGTNASRRAFSAALVCTDTRPLLLTPNRVLNSSLDSPVRSLTNSIANRFLVLNFGDFLIAQPIRSCRSSKSSLHKPKWVKKMCLNYFMNSAEIPLKSFFEILDCPIMPYILETLSLDILPVYNHHAFIAEGQSTRSTGYEHNSQQNPVFA